MEIIKSMRFLMLAILLLSGSNCNAQEVKEDVSLSILEIKELLNLIDTVSDKRNNNYHILFQEGFNKQTKIAEVWINDKWGETMFMDTLRICDFYPFKEGYIFVYLFKNCSTVIPEHLLRKSDDPYSYIEESPFYTKYGIHKTILIERRDSTHYYYYSLDLLNEGESFKSMLDNLKDMY